MTLENSRLMEENTGTLCYVSVFAYFLPQTIYTLCML